MSENYSKLLQHAESAFGKAQSQLFERQRAIEDLNSIVIARNEKTQRLREARLAKELRDSLASATKPASKRARKS
ncbi:hypothetical protein [Roseibium aggregatum]|uniref:hypothetical protein n=1 Tax=Roseibium aggregatum TaxID=187304 RepID=UPI001E4A2280|nr:hypothetical protein [Roseibium aggregatum]MCR9284827.1 hypothetical protein [Paracoccaceae bacterium]UES42246.1 hypothetical protein GFC08_30050 [Roseibium aggregatum]